MNQDRNNNRREETPHLIDESTRYRMDQFCEVCGVHHSVVNELVREGVIHPENDQGDSLVFSYRAVKRFKRAYRLQRDLDLNMSGVVVSVDLLEEIDRLKAEVSRLRIHLSALDTDLPDTEVD